MPQMTGGDGPSAAPRRGLLRSQAAHKAILEAAAELLLARGLGAVSMDAVAERAGSARPPSTAGGRPRKPSRWTRSTTSGPASRRRGIPAHCAVTCSRCCARGRGWPAARGSAGDRRAAHGSTDRSRVRGRIPRALHVAAAVFDVPARGAGEGEWPGVQCTACYCVAARLGPGDEPVTGGQPSCPAHVLGRHQVGRGTSRSTPVLVLTMPSTEYGWRRGLAGCSCPRTPPGASRRGRRRRWRTGRHT